MGKTLTEIAQQLGAADKKVQLIYAFNGMGKTRLSREFKQQIATEADDDEEADPSELSRNRILYYNALTEDLFYWDNDLAGDAEHKLKIQPNSFTDWVLKDQGQDQNIITTFQRYASDKLTPRFNEEYKVKGDDNKEITVKAFSEVTFSLERGDDEHSGNLKISKGEESNFIWSFFYTLIEQVIGVLNVAEPEERETDQFDQLKYIFVDDPVAESYQSEYDLEREFIQDLVNQGYEHLADLSTPEALVANVRVQLQTLNNVSFAHSEWLRFVETWLDKPSDGIVEKTRKIHDDYIHDFVFDDGRIQNIYLLDKKNIARNKVQVIKQFEQTGTGEARRGFVEVVKELEQRFPNPAAIEKEADKKAFAKLFGEYLRVENVLQNYDEFASLKDLQTVDMTDPAAVEAFKAKHYLSNDDLVALQAITLPAERKIQDYRSTYNDVRDWLRREKTSAEKEKSTIDWDDVVFEVDLLKSQEINLDYILKLIFEHNKKIKSKSELVDEVRRVIRASLGNRAKESLLVDFINQTDLDQFGDKASVIDAFFTFAQAEQQREAQELISAENLNAEAARRYITTSLKREFASDSGTELNAVLPKMSPLNPQYLTKKQSVFQKIAAFVEKFKGVGGVI